MATTDTALFPIEAACESIEQSIDLLRRCADDARARFERASKAGADLAAVVYRFTEDPEAVGTDALQAAYHEFMGRDSGNFGPSPDA